MIWKSILKTHLLDHNYAEMIKKVESHHHNHEQTKIEEIIVLDVNRYKNCPTPTLTPIDLIKFILNVLSRIYSSGY